MVEYLSDCPELVDKIKRKELDLRDIQYIVEYYNNQCF